MPNIDGFGFWKALKGCQKRSGKSRIVAFTSSNNKHDKDQAFLHKNVIQYITKPIKQSDIDQLKRYWAKHNPEFSDQATSGILPAHAPQHNPIFQARQHKLIMFV